MSYDESCNQNIMKPIVYCDKLLDLGRPTYDKNIKQMSVSAVQRVRQCYSGANV